MTINSSTRLTKFESAVTIVTATMANSWFGGLYGSTEGENYDGIDPVISGHVHDGQHIDGHAQKINLVTHVVDKLRNVNLGDNAVTKRTVASFISQNQAIPEFEIIDGVTYYHLDLSEVYDEIKNCFGIINVQASGTGVVNGDGTGAIEADIRGDTLSIVAGNNITITTNKTTDSITISGAAPPNNFTTRTVSAIGTGVASGGPVLADDAADTLAWVADNGIELVADGVADTIKIKNIANNFGSVNAGAIENGLFSGTFPLVADAMQDTLTVQSGYGIELVGNSTTDTLKIRNQYSMVYGIRDAEDLTNGVAGGWGAVAAVHLTDGGEEISYKSMVVLHGGVGGYVYDYLPVPRNNQGINPTRIQIRAYFVSKDDGLGYLAGLGPKPTFAVELELGSNSTQAIVGDQGSISNGQSILAGAQLIWTGAITQTSIQVVATDYLYILTWVPEVLEDAPSGLLPIRFRGAAGFEAAAEFDSQVGTNASIHFIKYDYTWQY